MLCVVGNALIAVYKDCTGLVLEGTNPEPSHTITLLLAEP